MLEQSGDIHHIVPKDYLKKNDFADRVVHNQVANYALTETSINVAISNKPPEVYMADVGRQIETGVMTLGEITDADQLANNLAANAVPVGLAEVDASRYLAFLAQRRKLMAAIIRDYYQVL